MKVIITGSSGMIGKGVLLECLDSDKIDKVLVINRKTINNQHPKLTEVLLNDFTKVDTIKDKLRGYDACFYCMGISALGMEEAAYTKITYDMTLAFANVLHEINPNIVFNFVSGVGTNSESGTMWQRVKGQAENVVLTKGFKNAFAFRPGMIIPERGIESRTSWYNFMYMIMRPFFSLLKRSKNVTTTTKIGLAMINTLTTNKKNAILEPPAINEMAS